MGFMKETEGYPWQYTCKTKNVKHTGDRLINYSTSLAEWDRANGTLIINETKYSVSTSRVQHYVRRHIPSHVHVIYVTNIPEGTLVLKNYVETNQITA